MAIWRLPWSREEQIKVCVALRNNSFIHGSEKDELGRIEQELERFRDLTVSEKTFLESLISRYGSSIDI